MGKVGRFACIITPMALTLASLICFVLVMIGQAPFKGNDAPGTELGRDLYFFRANTSEFKADHGSLLSSVTDKLNSAADLVGADSETLDKLSAEAVSKDLKDFYQIGLWSYCSGDRDANGKETITYCSARKFQFHFDPVEVWGLQNTTVQQVLGDDFTKGMNAYKKAAGWMNWAFVITVTLTAVEFIVGFFAIFSRWGSLVTTVVSTAQTIFALAAAATATAIYAAVTGVFKSVNGIHASMGSRMLGVLWLAVAFSVASGFFWLASVCCCSGKSPHKKVVVEKTPYTYERVESPAFGAQHAQQQHTGYTGQVGQAPTAYEPFRSRV